MTLARRRAMRRLCRGEGHSGALRDEYKLTRGRMQQCPVVTGPGRRQGTVRWWARLHTGLGRQGLGVKLREEVGRGQEVKGLECRSKAFGLEWKGGF